MPQTSAQLYQKRAVLVIFLIAESIFLAAQPLTKNHRKNGIPIILPVIGYTPETQLAFGAIAISLWHPKDTGALRTRTSNAELGALYTTKGQTIFLPKYTIFTKGENYYFDGIGEVLLNFPEYYYGIGDYTSVRNQERVAYQQIGWEAKWLKRVMRSRRLFAGIETRYFKRSDVDSNAGGVLATDKPPGFNGSTSAGAGPAVTWDERDNVINPTKGFYIDARYAIETKILGGTVKYERALLDLRKYFSLSHSSYKIIAIQFFSQFSQGSVPWKELPELGGPRLLRGYYRGRFRDKNLAAAQAEYRFSVYKWFGMVAFGGVGKVSASGMCPTSGLKSCYGAGVRVKIDKKENLNLRFDYAKGDKDHAGFFYFGLAESF